MRVDFNRLNPTDPFYTARDLAEKIGCCAATIYRYEKQGRFPPAIWLCGRKVWRESTLQKFLASVQPSDAAIAEAAENLKRS